MLINIGRWRILKKDSKKQFELWREMMDYQRSHPEKVFFTRSRFFTFTEKGSSEENWMFLDEYERSEDFDKWMKIVREDLELSKLANEFFPKWDALIIPGSKKSEVWTEVETLRVVPPQRS